MYVNMCIYINEVTGQLIFMNIFLMIQNNSQSPQKMILFYAHHKRASFLLLFYNLSH